MSYEVPANLSFTTNHVKKTYENKTMIRLVMACPLSEAFVKNGTACDCSGNEVAWKHVGCNEPDWVDAEGNIHCSTSCSSNKRPLFGDNFICGTDKSKVGKFKA